MLKHILINEIKKEILEIRLQVTFILFTLVFIIGSFTYVKLYDNAQKAYEKDYAFFIEGEREKAENLSELITQQKRVSQAPRANAFITDAGENVIPNQFDYNGYNVFEFSIKRGSSNAFIRPYQELNWVFIVGMLISFTVLLLSFDAISGEKEMHTLALTFSHPLSRQTYLFGKYLSVVIISLLAMLPGISISVLILILSKIIVINGMLMTEIFFFSISAFLLVSAMAALGLLCSLFTRTSNEGLLLALSLWLFFVLVIPNLTTLTSDYIIPVEPANLVEQRRQDAYNAINDAAPEGSWSANWGDPFYYQNELRARNRMNLMLSDKRVMDDYYSSMFMQNEKLMRIAMFSPVGAFEHFNEAITDGGFFRFMKNWTAINQYQETLLQFFKDKDAADSESPHWYNPFESLSTTRKPVNFEEVPRFTEKPAAFSNRLNNAGIFLLMMFLYTLIPLLGCIWKFDTYDLR